MRFRVGAIGRSRENWGVSVGDNPGFDRIRSGADLSPTGCGRALPGLLLPNSGFKMRSKIWAVDQNMIGLSMQFFVRRSSSKKHSIKLSTMRAKSNGKNMPQVWIA
jgi:hypothetical protein